MTITILKSQQEFTELTLYYVDINIITKLLLSLNIGNLSLYYKDVACTDNAQQIFWQEKKKNLTVHNGLEWPASVSPLCSHGRSCL
jgi:hypothetical protein